MTHPGGAQEGYTRRKYESEVYVEVVEANAGKPLRGEDGQDPAKVAGDYSIKSAEVYARRVAAEGVGYRRRLEASAVRYRAMPHEQLKAMVHDGTSAEDIDEQGILVNDLGNVFKELATAIARAASREQAGWQGQGADAAFRGLAGLADWFDASGDAAFLTANRFSQTSAAIANAQRGMPEPAGRTVTQSMDLAHQQLARGDIGGALDTYKNMQAQAELAFQTQQQAAAVLAARDEIFYHAGSNQPTFSPTPTPAMLAPATPTPSDSVGSSSAAIPDLGHTAAASAPSAAPAARVPPVTAASGSPPTTRLQGGETTGAGSSAESSLPVGGRKETSGLTANPGLDATLPAAGGSGPGIERGGSGRSGGSAGRAGGRGRVPTGGTGQEPGAGKKSGTAEPGAKPAAQAAREGIAGKTGASAIPGAAASGKKGEQEDKEHKRPGFLMETDPYDALGVAIQTDEHGNKIAPPVLGE